MQDEGDGILVQEQQVEQNADLIGTSNRTVGPNGFINSQSSQQEI
jgi:hypothetical protein